MGMRQNGMFLFLLFLLSVDNGFAVSYYFHFFFQVFSIDIKHIKGSVCQLANSLPTFGCASRLHRRNFTAQTKGGVKCSEVIHVIRCF